MFEVDGDEVDLWTSGGDGTAKCLSRLKHFATHDSFSHGDHVRAVAVTDAWVVTAGRDEDVKVWDRASGSLYASLQGHYDEVTDLVLLKGPTPRGDRLCSVSLDGTIRTWPLDRPSIDALAKEQEQQQQQPAASSDQGRDGGDGGGGRCSDECRRGGRAGSLDGRRLA